MVPKGFGSMLVPEVAIQQCGGWEEGLSAS